MTMRCLLFLAVLFPSFLSAQEVPVPFTTASEVFMVFSNGRFTRLEPRPPQVFFAQEGRLIYLDHVGQLKVFRAEEQVLNLLDKGPVSAVKASRKRVAWTVHDSLRTTEGLRVRTIGTAVERFEVSDGLVVFHEVGMGTLQAWWKGSVYTLADVAAEAEGPLWAQSNEDVVFHTGGIGSLRLFRQGELRTLMDSTPGSMVVAGGSLVAWWDDGRQVFTVLDGERQVDIADTRPWSAKAGPGFLAFVDGTDRLKCYEQGQVQVVASPAPAAYWVQDSLLLYPHEGHFMLHRAGGNTIVERYVPEQWQVWDSRLVYLNIDRQVCGMLRGDRLRCTPEAAIPRFDLFGDAVVHPGRGGTMVVMRGRRTYTF
jgi:hypothetical protein